MISLVSYSELCSSMQKTKCLMPLLNWPFFSLVSIPWSTQMSWMLKERWVGLLLIAHCGIETIHCPFLLPHYLIFLKLIA